MKRNLAKRALCVGLALTMAAGLCACGGDSSTGGGGKTGGKSGSGNANANAALAKENVYRAQDIDIPQLVDLDNGYVDVRQTLHVDGKVKILLKATDWATDESKLCVLTMDEDGSNIETLWLSASADGAEEEETDDETADSPETEPADDGGEDYGDVDVASIYDESNTWDYENFNAITMTESGMIYGIRYTAHEDYSDPDNYVSEQHYYACLWNSEGESLGETEIEELRSTGDEEEYLYAGILLTESDGSADIILTGDNVYSIHVSQDGTVSGKKPLADDIAAILNRYQYCIPKNDGSFLIVYSDEDDWTKTYLTDYNFETGAIGERTQLPSSFAWSGVDSINAGINDDIVYANSSGVFRLNAGDAEPVKMMDYINSDVYITNLSGFCQLDDNSFIALYTENYAYELKCSLFTYVAPEQIADRAAIVLAGNYIDSDMLQRVVQFNKTNENYRIVTKDYSQYNTYDDYNAGVTQLNNDIVTGNMPDILLADGLPVENYIAKGLIADINPLIEADEELSQTEFMQNVFDAFTVDGKLCYIVPSFYVSTYVAKASLVGDGSDWSMEKMQAIVDGLGEDAQAFGEMSRDNFMNMAFQYCGSDFIDIATGKCRFDSDDFIAMMAFAQTLPEEIDWDSVYSDESYWNDYDSQYRDNRTLLMQMSIGSLDLTYELNGSFGGDFAFVGFPTEEGSGSYISAGTPLVLSAKSDCLEGAWEFARYYLTDEYQSSLTWGLSVNRKYFLEQAEKGKQRPSYTDYGTGEVVEYDQTFWMNGEEITLDPLSDEQMDRVVAFIESVDSPYYYDSDVLDIVNEELGAYYSGQKSAKDTASVIQNRVQLYVEENR